MCYKLFIFKLMNYLFQLWQEDFGVVCTIVDDEVGLLPVLFWTLHLHAGSDLLLRCSVAFHGPLEANLLGRIHEEDVIDRLVEAALEEYGTL